MTPKIVCVAGPTACGKTTLGVLLAQRFHGEVVSADSMQIYRGMTVGTAAPTEAEMQGVPHHMIAVAEPSEQWSAAEYVAKATPIVDDILSRGKLPILVGGTGLWMDALIRGHGFAGGHAGGEVRRELETRLTGTALSRCWQSCGRWTRKAPHGSIPPTPSAFSERWRSIWKRARPSPPTMLPPANCLPGMTRYGSACNSRTGPT